MQIVKRGNGSTCNKRRATVLHDVGERERKNRGWGGGATERHGERIGDAQ